MKLKRHRRYKAKDITPADMSLLHFCLRCGGQCCVGRTMVSEKEKEQIVQYSGKDHFIHWANDLYFLDKGTCPYLKDGFCSVQEVKPFVCQIFPFVPRVVDSEFWLFCVVKCDASKKLPACYAEKAKALAQAFFANRKPEVYARYWNQNKVGDFNDDEVVLKLKVYDKEEDERRHG